jgi:hypothetical protein
LILNAAFGFVSSTYKVLAVFGLGGCHLSSWFDLVSSERLVKTAGFLKGSTPLGEACFVFGFNPKYV